VMKLTTPTLMTIFFDLNYYKDLKTGDESCSQSSWMNVQRLIKLFID
jgi:hypothetical protein